MTAQIPDTFALRGEEHALVGIKGRGLFEPSGPDGTTEAEVGARVEQCFDRSYL